MHKMVQALDDPYDVNVDQSMQLANAQPSLASPSSPKSARRKRPIKKRKQSTALRESNNVGAQLSKIDP